MLRLYLPILKESLSETDLPEWTCLPPKINKGVKTSQSIPPQGLEKNFKRHSILEAVWESKERSEGRGRKEGTRRNTDNKSARLLKAKTTSSVLTGFLHPLFRNSHQRRDRREIILMCNGFFKPFAHKAQLVSMIYNKI